MKNKAHMDNFKTAASKRYAIIDNTMDAIKGSQSFEIVSGRTVEQAKERFYSRYMIRSSDREMIAVAQKNNRLTLVLIDGGTQKLIERDLFLIAEVI